MPKRISKYRGAGRMSQLGVLFNADGDGGGGTPPAANPPAGDPPGDNPEGDKPLGEPGKKALDAERSRANEAEKRAKAAEKALADLQQAHETGDQKAQREAEQALQKARDEAAAAARAEVMAERVMDKIELAAKGKFTDVADAQLNLRERAAEFVKNGAIDTDAITAAVDKLLEEKPHYAATKTPVPPPGLVGIGTGGSSASDAAVRPGVDRLRSAYAQSTPK